MLDKCGNIIVGLVCLVLICLLLGLNQNDIIIIILISILVIFGFLILDNSQKYYHKRINELNTEYINNINNKNNQNNLNNQDNLNNQNNLNNQDNLNNHNNDDSSNQIEVMEQIVKKNINNINVNKEIPYHLQDTEDAIIPADKYNLEDCTTDKSCIQQPDIHNLYQLEPNKINNIKMEIDARKNNKKCNNKPNNKNKLVIENFESKSPEELNDVVLPFAEYNINPFAKQDNFKTTNYTNIINGKPCNINDNLCFHCKIGECQGGSCKDLNEINMNGLAKKIINDTRPELPHPFSDEFPVIRVTNDEVAQ
jgi:hypothetical protein